MQIAHRQVSSAATAALTSGGLSPLLARLYAGRGVQSMADLDLSLARLAPPTLAGLPAAAQVLADAVMSGQRIVVVGDYDCDGATSTALSVLALEAMGGVVDFLVPDRFRHGYGLTPTIVELAQATHQAQVLMTVDNGISSLAGVAAAQAAGMRVVVTDHHLAGESIPAADAVVNPNQPGCPFPWKSTAGVGVAFYVMVATLRDLQARGWFASGRTPPQPSAWLDLVALGTVADVVALEHNNRILVEQGLRRLRAGQGRPGIRALMQVAGVRPETIQASDFGFLLGPRLNAAGRMADMGIGIRCLISADSAQALALAEQLDGLNRERRAVEQTMRASAEATLSDPEQVSDAWGLCLYQRDWHQGVIGILAGRLKESLHRPVIVFADGDPEDQGPDAEIKGSARSIDGFHLRDALADIAAAHPDLIRKFGGHAMAAGLTLRRADFTRFAACFDALVRARLDPSLLQGRVETDGPLAPADLSLATCDSLMAAGPWGQGFPPPCFDGTFRVKAARVLKGKHLKLQLDGGMEAIQFSAPDLRVDAGDLVRLVYTPEASEWQGVRRLQLLVQHLGRSGN